MKTIKTLNKDDLYGLTGWFSVDCEKLVSKLKKCGLAIVAEKEVVEHNKFCNVLEDDLK